MRQILLRLFHVAVLTTVLAACLAPGGAVVPRPYIQSASWQNTDRNKLYQTCLQALHLQGYELHPQMTTRESGLIVTQDHEFQVVPGSDGVFGAYRLNILVTEGASINIQAKARWRTGTGAWMTVPTVKTLVGNRLSDDMKELIASLDRSLGEMSVRTTATLVWK